jgi:hypothetical protein
LVLFRSLSSQKRGKLPPIPVKMSGAAKADRASLGQFIYRDILETGGAEYASSRMPLPRYNSRCPPPDPPKHFTPLF